jgi:hypothetical protein
MIREQPGIMKKKQQEVQQMRMQAKLEELKAYMQANRHKRNADPLKAQPIRSNSNRIVKPAPPQAASRDDLSALTSTETGLSQVKQFLTGCGLERYFEELTHNGIDDMEILLELSDSHLNGLNIPLGHRIKLLKRIKEVRDNGPPRQQTPSPPHKPLTLEPSDKSFGVASDFFKQALDQFKKGGSASQRVAIVEGLINSTSDKQTTREPVRTRSLTTTTSTMTATGESKASCWQCYSLHAKSQGRTFYNKDFCSDSCCDLFIAAQQLVCKCGEKFIRASGVLRLGTRYCSEECVSKVHEEEPEDISR